MKVRVRPRDDYTRPELADLMHWLEDAYEDGPWRPEHWDEIGPGPHIVAERSNGELLAHACIAWVPVRVGETILRAGYLEDVATRKDLRGRGYGTAVVAAASPIIEADADIGFLATGSQPFYEQLGWLRWRGPSSVREADGSITPTPEEDGNIMAMLFSRTPAWVSVEQPIERPRRDPEEAW
jgi:aminoglycoside 2'-N-acetyltransferase I